MSGGGNVTNCWGGGVRHAVALVFLAPESSCDEEEEEAGGFSLQTGGRTAAGWGEPEPEQLQHKKKKKNTNV